MNFFGNVIFYINKSYFVIKNSIIQPIFLEVLAQILNHLLF